MYITIHHQHKLPIDKSRGANWVGLGEPVWNGHWLGQSRLSRLVSGP